MAQAEKEGLADATTFNCMHTGGEKIRKDTPVLARVSTAVERHHDNSNSFFIFYFLFLVFQVRVSL